jgi:hypothetical protein
MSEKMENVPARKLREIRQISDSDEIEEVVEAVVEADLSTADVRELNGLPEASRDPLEAVEKMEQVKKAGQKAESLMIDRMRFGDQTGSAIKQAARASGKSESAIIKNAVQYYLREEGYI